MNFAPKSETQLEEERRKRMQLLIDGEADFVVKSALDKNAQKDGREMIEIQCECTDSAGTTKVIKDWLHPAMEHKVRHFCYAVGLGSLYERGELAAEHVEGRGGRCMIRTDKDKSGKYPDKNEIRDYVVAAQTKQTSGYQNAKGNGAATQQKPVPSSAELAKRKAWAAYKAKWPDAPTAETQEAFKVAAAGYFRGKPFDLINGTEWEKFVADEFVRKPGESPIPDEPVFTESDIPF